MKLKVNKIKKIDYNEIKLFNPIGIEFIDYRIH